MIDPFAYNGPKSAERLEDERYIRALRMRDIDGLSYRKIGKALGLTYNIVLGKLQRIDKAADAMEALDAN
jgi:DNA-directed RNA polymerase specialized sigma24 family protein